MPTAMAPEVLADPVGVLVDLVTRRRPGLAPGVITDVVLGVAGGRVKQRRLAQTLSDRTDLLIDGRSPAPRVVGDLLIALGNAGAVNISLPVCAGCGRQLRTLQRRGQDWYCSVCGPRREPCAGCGKTRPICYRDRHGGPRCAHGPPADGQDPTQLLVDFVAAVDPTIPADTVAAAALAAAGRTGQRLQLAWALQDAPELLTGQGARAPVPSVLRLIDTLCQAGAVHIRRPACPRCGRVITLVRPRDGIRLCRNCLAKSKAEPCSRCGAVREPAARDEHHRPLCPHCLITDPANQESCTGCGRRRPVQLSWLAGSVIRQCGHSGRWCSSRAAGSRTAPQREHGSALDLARQLRHRRIPSRGLTSVITRPQRGQAGRRMCTAPAWQSVSISRSTDGTGALAPCPVSSSGASCSAHASCRRPRTA